MKEKILKHFYPFALHKLLLRLLSFITDSQAQVITIRLSLKGQRSFQLEISEIVYHFGPHFDCPTSGSRWIRIRNTGGISDSPVRKLCPAGCRAPHYLLNESGLFARGHKIWDAVDRWRGLQNG